MGRRDGPCHGPRLVNGRRHFRGNPRLLEPGPARSCTSFVFKSTCGASASSMKLVRLQQDYAMDATQRRHHRRLLRANDHREDTYIRPLAYRGDGDGKSISRLRLGRSDSDQYPPDAVTPAQGQATGRLHSVLDAHLRQRHAAARQEPLELPQRSTGRHGSRCERLRRRDLPQQPGQGLRGWRSLLDARARRQTHHA